MNKHTYTQVYTDTWTDKICGYIGAINDSEIYVRKAKVTPAAMHNTLVNTFLGIDLDNCKRKHLLLTPLNVIFSAKNMLYSDEEGGLVL